MYNSITLIGRLTKDPELKYTQNNTPVCKMSVAVNRTDKGADFFDVIVWNKQGENCANYMSKGKLAAVDGELHIRTYEKQDGSKAYVTEVVADQVRFLSPKTDSEIFNGGGTDEERPF